MSNDPFTQPVSRAGKSRWGQRGTAAATIAARLSFEHITHRYGSVVAVDDVSLEIEPGEIICLLGHSGCGKTTLLRIAAGVERQTSGRVLINGQVASGPGVFQPPEKRGVGLMFQDYALFPHLTILDNVAFGLTTLSRADARSEAEAALRRMGLENYGGEYPHALSGGEQQRVALARAIAPRPSVLLMDEPFSGLDRQLRGNVRDETLAVLRETRATCIIVTHDPEEAMRLADRIALMRQGKIVQIGRAEDLYKHPADLFTARFFSEFNEFAATVVGQRVPTPVGDFAANGFAAGAEVDVCIRPQGVRVMPAGQGIAGRVLRRRFLGDLDLVEIAVEGLDTSLKSRVPGGIDIAVGNEAGIEIDPAEVLIFERATPTGE